MLSVWKRSWKEKDPPADGHQDMLDGLSSSVSSLDSTAAAHPSNAALAPTTHFEDSGLGRRRAQEETLCRMTPETSVAQHKKNGDPEPWSYLLRTDITITTPESLLSSFGSGELDMNQVQLLIFTNVGDSQGHLFPIVQKIMKSFYMVTDRLSRPRILGFLLLSEAHMTSFVASELEGLMDSKVLQIYGYELTDISQEHPAEVVLLYEKAPPGLRSTLADKLLSIASSDWFLSKHLSDSQAVFDEVGSCAGDLFWRRAFRESDAQNENSRNTTASGQDRLRNGIKNWGFSLPNLDPTSLRFNVSHKFLALVKALESCEPYGEAFRGIVLVELQSVALAIADMLRILDGSTLSFRPLSLHPNATSPIRRQEISRLFAAGVYNILILPKLDNSIHAPHTSVIISFNAECLKIGKDVDQAQPAFVIHLTQNNSEVLRSPVSHGEQRPESQTIEYADGVDLFASIQDPTTGSRLYLRDSVVAAERLTSIGQLNGVKIDQVLFSYEERMDALGAGCIFSCTVTIPRLLQLTGPPLQTKLDAKRAACFKFCQHLFSLGLLDCRFFPPPKLLDITSHDFDKQQNPKEPNATGPRRYSRKEPEFWRNTRTIPIAMLYPIIISTTAPDIDKQPYAPLAILTRQPLPDLASFNVFHSGIPTVVSIKRGAPLQIDQTQLNDIYSYTLRVCRTVSNKPFQCSSANMVYFFVPLKSAWASSGGNDPASPFNLPSIANCIPWDLVQLAGSSFNAPLKTGSLEETERDLKDAVIQDRSVEFTRRYAAVRLRPDLSPLSKPLDSPREAAFDSLLEFTKTRRKDFEELQDVNQPLVEVITIPAVLNQLNPTSRPAPLPKTHAKCKLPFLCLASKN
ncbi:hypothetical protein DXG01_010586 [Tephrocybe rancida]|nr:hypothetical protein DXG01_010586 [Tephrocybe rancida]